LLLHASHDIAIRHESDDLAHQPDNNERCSAVVHLNWLGGRTETGHHKPATNETCRSGAKREPLRCQAGHPTQKGTP
jgi:hypothetical protein